MRRDTDALINTYVTGLQYIHIHQTPAEHPIFLSLASFIAFCQTWATLVFVISDPLTVGNTVAKCFRAQTPSSPPAQLNLLNFCRFVSFASFSFLYTFLNINGTKITFCGSCYFLGDVQKFSRFYSMLFLSRNTSVVSHRRSRCLIFGGCGWPMKTVLRPLRVFRSFVKREKLTTLGFFVLTWVSTSV